jgi:methylmalonyl-CoA mutase cobalamin-binding subunit
MENKPEKRIKTVVAAALGECVHVAGVNRFLRLAELTGWRTIFLGPAVPTEEVIQAAVNEKADLIAVSYRLTPETGERLLAEFAEAADELHSGGIRFAFAGTPPVAERAKALGFFEKVFEGGEPADTVLAYLKGQAQGEPQEADFPQSTVKRIAWKRPYPILRHHFGLPSMDDTIQGISKIAKAKAIDVISLGIDQDAQANFFRPERQNVRQRGAGGVPVRTPDDYRKLFAASRAGNFPLMRTYSGTDDFIKLAEMYLETINIAWCAIPLFWFNKMDGRGPWDLEGSIREHQKVMAWYGERKVPVELNEPHHWGMRDAPDVIFVVSAYLSAYNARAFGVQDYIAQLMLNSPAELSDAMDLAKMLAVLEMITQLKKPNFNIYRETRTGLLSYPLEINAARAHLAASIYLQMALKPDIIHIVGHTEAIHAATAEDIIESSLLANRSIENAIAGQPNMTSDPKVQERKEELVIEAQSTLEVIRSLAESDVREPFIDPRTLTKAVECGILDAPQLKNNPVARGNIMTRIDPRGACLAVNPESGEYLSEIERIKYLKID